MHVGVDFGCSINLWMMEILFSRVQCAPVEHEEDEPSCIRGRTIDASIVCGNLSWGSSFKLELLIGPTGARSSGGTLPKKLFRAKWTCLGELSFWEEVEWPSVRFANVLWIVPESVSIWQGQIISLGQVGRQGVEVGCEGGVESSRLVSSWNVRYPTRLVHVTQRCAQVLYHS